MLDKDQRGFIFNIQNFSVHDGEGIRTNVFLKGCSLSCVWCCNPESQAFRPEKAFNAMRCLSVEKCGYCVKVCPSNALVNNNGVLSYTKSQCTACGNCVAACPSRAQFFYGEEISVDEVLQKVQNDSAFYARSGGGLTLSGGEAMVQPRFALALLREAKRRHLNTTIETCGHCKTEDLREAARYLDAVIMDIKSLNSEKHKIFTGADCGLIVQNATMLLTEFPNLPIIFRTPIIPTFNDTEEDVQAIRSFIPKRYGIQYELLQYHRFGQAKYGYLGRSYSLDGLAIDNALMASLRASI